jgi:hypothetical protein
MNSALLNGFLACAQDYPRYKIPLRFAGYIHSIQFYIGKGLLEYQDLNIASRVANTYNNIDPKYVIPSHFTKLEMLCMLELLIKYYTDTDMTIEKDGINNQSFRE